MQNNGVVIINKPTGMSSNFAVNLIKRKMHAKKAGHLGTLDPFGAGVLPVTLNKATRLFDFLVKKEKTYRTIFKFGVTTDTLDCDGIITERNEKKVNEEEIKKAIVGMEGDVEQMPPDYSAKKIDGQCAYSLARAGKELTLKPKKVHIKKIELIKKIKENTFLFEIECGEGTYVRSICRDIARKMSTYGVMCAICRTKCGAMQIKNSQSVNQNEFSIIPAQELLDMPNIDIGSNNLKTLIDGKPIINMYNYALNQFFKVFAGSVFVGVGIYNENNILKIVANIMEDSND